MKACPSSALFLVALSPVWNMSLVCCLCLKRRWSSYTFQYCYVVNNHLLGRIPTSVGNMTTSYQISMSNNQVEGLIREEIFNFDSLLDLSKNKLCSSVPSCSNLSWIRHAYLKTTNWRVYSCMYSIVTLLWYYWTLDEISSLEVSLIRLAIYQGSALFYSKVTILKVQSLTILWSEQTKHDWPFF